MEEKITKIILYVGTELDILVLLLFVHSIMSYSPSHSIVKTPPACYNAPPFPSSPRIYQQRSRTAAAETDLKTDAFLQFGRHLPDALPLSLNLPHRALNNPHLVCNRLERHLLFQEVKVLKFLDKVESHATGRASGDVWRVAVLDSEFTYGWPPHWRHL